MKIVIDMQGAQSSGSRNRGIGRYAIGLAKAMLRQARGHEIHLALNGIFSDSIGLVRDEFQGLLPDERIHVFHPLKDVSQLDDKNRDRRLASELYRELYLSHLKPDVIHTTSLFEGFIDDSVTSLKKLESGILQSVTLFDLIPLIHQKPYLENEAYRRWYFDKLDNLRRADLLLAISHSSRQEAILHLGLTAEAAIYVGTAADSHFKKLKINLAQEADLRLRLGLKSSFVLYTGGIDHRKNIEKLIEAYGLLPKAIRRKHQLAIICTIQDADRKRLGKLAQKVGLETGEVVFTGFVSETDLVALYNLCRLFVFPSWHEGFGLPVLEAMKCGAPVIASSLSSLPEIVQKEEAIFNPHDASSIAAKIKEALSDESFRQRLIKNSQRRASLYDWDECAVRALQAMETLWAQRKTLAATIRSYRPKLAYVSPLPTAKSGIADYSAELIPELAKYYDVHLFIKDDVHEVRFDGVPETYPLEKLSQLLSTWQEFDRVLYHFGNSDHHDSYFEALRTTSGVVVLHDFYLGNILQHKEHTGQEPGAWVKAIHFSHGLQGVLKLQEEKSVWQFPASLQVIEDAKHIILHSPSTLKLAEEWFGPSAAEKCSLIPLLRIPVWKSAQTREGSRQSLGIEADELVVCTFGHVALTKMSQVIFNAWIRSKLATNKVCRLVFVGQNETGDYGSKLAKSIKASKLKNVSVTGWLRRDEYKKWLAAADVAVQLRSHSRGETSAAVLDCMNYDLPVIANAVGSMADLPKDCLVMLKENFSEAELIKALETLHELPEQRAKLGGKASRHVHNDHNPAGCAKRYFDQIEKAYRVSPQTDQFVRRIAPISLSQSDATELCENVASVTSVTPKRLFIDVSEITNGDYQTGIQRVVRNLIRSAIDLASCPIFLVRFDYTANVFRHACKFSHQLLNCFIAPPDDSVVNFTTRDELLFMDLCLKLTNDRVDRLRILKESGVKMHCVVYDLLPIKWPEFFVKGGDGPHLVWAKWMTTCDTALCISESVARDVRAFVEEHAPESKISIKSFALGSTLDQKSSTEPQLNFSSSVGLDLSKPTFLMVGTLEPRKGHADVLAAFKTLREKGVQANLCIVGKQGWMVEDLVKNIEKTQRHERSLAWLNHVSDDLLQHLYKKSTCLIAASFDEGFGLPLVEAAQHDLPIIARNISVFREVCGNHATYFENDLEKVVSNWLGNYIENRHIRSNGIKPISWNDSAKSLLKLIKLFKAESENEIFTP